MTISSPAAVNPQSGRTISQLLIAVPVLLVALCFAGKYGIVNLGPAARGTIIFTLLFALMVTGMPVSIALGLSVLTFLFTLTNVPVEKAADAQERVSWYEQRPIIEEYHKGKKTGCRIESMQFDAMERLEPAIAVLSVVTTTLLQLRDAARAPDADRRLATAVIGSDYVDVLATHYGKRLGPQPTIRKFYLHVARLGGVPEHRVHAPARGQRPVPRHPGGPAGPAAAG